MSRMLFEKRTSTSQISLLISFILLMSKDAGLVTHGVNIGRFDGPYPFILDADYPGHMAKDEAA